MIYIHKLRNFLFSLKIRNLYHELKVKTLVLFLKEFCYKMIEMKGIESGRGGERYFYCNNVQGWNPYLPQKEERQRQQKGVELKEKE